MKNRFNEILEKVLKSEGGFVETDDEIDRGGHTYAGISRRANSKWKGWKYLDEAKKEKEKGNIEKANELKEEAKKFVYGLYKKKYWDSMKLDKVSDPRVKYVMFDWGVNSGTKISVQFAQKVVGVVRDGIVGSKTIKAINDYDVETFVSDFRDERLGFIYGIIANDPTQKKYERGWKNRIDRVSKETFS